ncbi:MAG TPA: lysozyme [Bryobacteraceae bacterium]|nr:lysozyme [Bryobacteraceae bacterium]
MRISPAGIDLIKSFESLRLEAYRCPAGVWTVGWGHTRGVQPGMRISMERAAELLAEDIAEVERDLPSVVHVNLTQGQWDALVSLCFNLSGGAPRLPHTCPHLVASLNAGDFAGAARQFLDINHAAGGGVLPGLTRRREAESKLFLG